MNITSRVCIGLFLIAHSLLIILAVLASGAAYFHFVYGPTKEFKLELGKETLLDSCDPTTDEFEDLVLTPDMSIKHAAYIGNRHGAVIVPGILTKETSNELRDLVLGMNAKHSSGEADIASPANRYRVQPSYKIPIVKKALKEVVTHPQFKLMMEEILGPNPSFTSLDAITATFGAKDQLWHWDADTSSAIYPDEFLAEWGLSIFLQDTTDEMGATGLCPGTHKCGWVNVPDDEEEQDQELLDEICPLKMSLSQGDGFVYKQDTIHKGRAHTDRHAGDRVLFTVGFSESKQGPDDNRIYPMGDIGALNWDMWGQTIDDLGTIDERPWRPWHPFGFFNGHEGVRPCTIFDSFAQAYVHENEACYVFHTQIGRFYQDRIHEWVVSLMLIVFGLAVLLYGVLLPCGLFFSYRSRPSDPDARKGSTANGMKHHAD